MTMPSTLTAAARERARVRAHELLGLGPNCENHYCGDHAACDYLTSEIQREATEREVLEAEAERLRGVSGGIPGYVKALHSMQVQRDDARSGLEAVSARCARAEEDRDAATAQLEKSTDGLRRANAILNNIKTERDEARRWVNDLQSGMWINCVYCGHRYGPNPGTPVAMADVLKAHIEACPSHPLSEARRHAAALEARCERLREALVNIATSGCEGDDEHTNCGDTCVGHGPCDCFPHQASRALAKESTP